MFFAAPGTQENVVMIIQEGRYSRRRGGWTTTIPRFLESELRSHEDNEEQEDP